MSECEIVMQPFNNWRGNLEVRDSDGVLHILNDDVYTADTEVHEVFTIANVTDLWWGDKSGGPEHFSHYEVVDCKFTREYEAAWLNGVKQQDSVVISLSETPTTLPSTTSTTNAPPAPPTTVVLIPPVSTTSTPSSTTLQNPPSTNDLSTTSVGVTPPSTTTPILPVTGPENLVLTAVVGFATLMAGTAALLKSRMGRVS